MTAIRIRGHQAVVRRPQGRSALAGRWLRRYVYARPGLLGEGAMLGSRSDNYRLLLMSFSADFFNSLHHSATWSPKCDHAVSME